MKNIQKKVSFIEICLLIFNICFIFFITGLDARLKNIIVILFLIIIFILSVYLLSYKKDNNFDRERAIKIELAIFIGFLFIYFLLGLFVGFSKTSFSISFNEMLNGVIPNFLILLLTELIRYVLFKSIYKSKKNIIIITILLIILNISLEFKLNYLNNHLLLFVYITTIVFPVIANELLCSYSTYNFGLLPTIIYKSVIKLYIYIIPIFPNLTDYLYSVFNIIIPFISYISFRKYIVKVDRLTRNTGRDKVYRIGIMTIPIMVFTIVITALVSGLFSYQLIAIASGSMEPTYTKGDALLLYKDSPDNIEVGDILVYKDGKKIVAHRVIKKTEYKNNLYFYTKGDANNAPDDGYIEKENVIGRGINIVKYIGYPTVWLNEFFRKE